MMPIVIRKKKLDSALVQMIVLDFEPFNLVYRKGIRRFISVNDPKYELPSKTHLKEVIFPELHANLKEELNHLLSEVAYVAISSDLWTSPATEGYLTITCHFIHGGTLRTAVLSTSNLMGNHTAVAIADAVRSILEEYNIRRKTVCIVTDNGSNMIAAAGLLKIFRALPTP